MQNFYKRSTETSYPEGGVKICGKKVRSLIGGIVTQGRGHGFNFTYVGVEGHPYAYEKESPANHIGYASHLCRVFLEKNDNLGGKFGDLKICQLDKWFGIFSKKDKLLAFLGASAMLIECPSTLNRNKMTACSSPLGLSWGGGPMDAWKNGVVGAWQSSTNFSEILCFKFLPNFFPKFLGSKTAPETPIFGKTTQNIETQKTLFFHFMSVICFLASSLSFVLALGLGAGGFVYEASGLCPLLFYFLFFSTFIFFIFFSLPHVPCFPSLALNVIALFLFFFTCVPCSAPRNVSF
jgi:hypothetical protein